MKYALVVKFELIKAEQFANKLRLFLNEHHHTYDEINPDIVFTIGGDGTLLGAIHKYISQIDKITFLPFMEGHLGFYVDFSEEDLADLNKIIESANILHLPLLEANIKGETLYAINEFSLGQFAHASAFDIYVNNQLIEHYYGSGILFSTTFGSTAYNRSLGGPIIDLGLNLIIMSKIAPINSKKYNSITSPIVFNNDKIIKLEYKSKHKQILTQDNVLKSFDNFDFITIKMSEKNVKLFVKNEYKELLRLKKVLN